MGRTHTWPLILHYHRCEKCGLVFESREDWEVELGQKLKYLTCKRCQHKWVAYKDARRT